MGVGRRISALDQGADAERAQDERPGIEEMLYEQAGRAEIEGGLRRAIGAGRERGKRDRGVFFQGERDIRITVTIGPGLRGARFRLRCRGGGFARAAFACSLESDEADFRDGGDRPYLR